MELMLTLLIVILLLLVAAILMIPIERKKAKKRKREEVIKPQDDSVEKNWQAKVTHLEHHIQSLQKQTGEWEKRFRLLEKELAVETVKNTKLQEKLTQERSWHEKEDVEVAKFNKEIHQLKVDLKQIQENYSKEHMVNLKLENELKELQRKHEDLTKQRRDGDLENDQLKAKIDSFKRDMAELKKENVLLQKKENDKQWVAMTEYQKLEMKLKDVERELGHLKKEEKNSS